MENTVFLAAVIIGVLWALFSEEIKKWEKKRRHDREENHDPRS